MKETALILGGEGGIAGAISKRLAESYDIQQASRSSKDFSGNLKDPEFRRQLVELTNPAIVISGFGEWQDSA